jgi:hypothetical protein
LKPYKINFFLSFYFKISLFKEMGGWLRFGIYPKEIWTTPVDTVIQTMEACIIIISP